MGKVASPATLLRHAKRDLQTTRGALELCKQQRQQLETRLTAMTKDRDEWKARFDKLLERMPEDPL